MGMLFRMLAPKPLKKARRVAHPVSMVTPRPVKRAKMADRRVVGQALCGDCPVRQAGHAEAVVLSFRACDEPGDGGLVGQHCTYMLAARGRRATGVVSQFGYRW